MSHLKYVCPSKKICLYNSDSDSLRIWKLDAPVHITATFFTPCFTWLFFFFLFFAFRIGFRVWLKWINYNNSIYSKWCLFTSILCLCLKQQTSLLQKENGFGFPGIGSQLCKWLRILFWNRNFASELLSQKLVVKDYKEGGYQVDHYRCLSF